MIEILEKPEITEKEEGRHVVYTFQNKTFRLDKEKARERLRGKRVINGLRSAELNVLPLKYHEAYRIYKQMSLLLALALPPQRFYQVREWYAASNFRRMRGILGEPKPSAPVIESAVQDPAGSGRH